MSLETYRLGPEGVPIVVAIACPFERATINFAGRGTLFGDIVNATFTALKHATDVHVCMTHVTACCLVPEHESDVDAYRSTLTRQLRTAIGRMLHARAKAERDANHE